MLVAHPIKDAIAAENDKVMEIGLDRELADLRLRYKYSLLATVLAPLAFNIAKCPRHAQTARQYPMRPEHQLLLHRTQARQLDMLDLLTLINTASIGLNPRNFVIFIRPVISGQ